MKKLSIIIIALLAILVCCKKTPEVNIKYVDVEREVLTIGSTTANIQCDYEYIATLKSAKLYYGRTEDNMNYVNMRVVQSVLYAEITGLESNTNYKYYYEFENGFNSMQSGVKTFTTEENPTTVVLPTVITADVTEITSESAVSGGEVTSDGGGNVTERGICWSLTNNPTLSNSHLAIGNGVGVFSATIDSLAANTTYHVRAYAINEAGTAYGLDKEFTTYEGGSSAELPTVATSDVTEITTNSATCGGNVISDGGAEVTERGICWSTNANPTINNNHVVSGSGMGSYTASMTGLVSNTTYHVRAYATNEAGIAYGLDKEFTTLNGGGGGDAPTGAINGLFTINGYGGKVYFSQGNLQYQASTNTWRFAEHQWDFVGDGMDGTVFENNVKSNNSLISPTYEGWIDLFGWGTSGYNHGAICYQPWSISENNEDYYAYGSWSANLYDQTGMADWGYNSIINGGNEESLWRTMSISELQYILFGRTTESGALFTKAKLENRKGLIILPDNWNVNVFQLNDINHSEAPFNSNVITLSDWEILESNGAVFLPTTGVRHGNHVSGNVNDFGDYWTSSPLSGDSVPYFGIEQTFSPNGYSSWHRYLGYAVRLVQDYYNK